MKMNINFGENYGFDGIYSVNLNTVIKNLTKSHQKRCEINYDGENGKISIILMQNNKNLPFVDIYFKTLDYEGIVNHDINKSVEQSFREKFDEKTCIRNNSPKNVDWQKKINIFESNLINNKFSIIQKKVDYRFIPLIGSNKEKMMKIWKMKVLGNIYKPFFDYNPNYNELSLSKTELIAYNLQPIMFLDL